MVLSWVRNTEVAEKVAPIKIVCNYRYLSAALRRMECLWLFGYQVHEFRHVQHRTVSAERDAGIFRALNSFMREFLKFDRE